MGLQDGELGPAEQSVFKLLSDWHHDRVLEEFNDEWPLHVVHLPND